MSKIILSPLQIPRWFQIASQNLDSEYIDFVYAADKLYITGTTLEQSVTFTFSGTAVTKPISTSKCGFVVCLDANTGSYIWHSWILGSGDEIPTSIALTNSDTELIVCGSSSTTNTSFSVSDQSVGKPATTGTSSFILNLDSADGAYNWSQWIHGSGDEYTRALAIGSDASIYVYGDSTTTDTSITIAGSAETKPATVASAAFLVKLASAGTFSFGQWIYGSANTFGRSFTIDPVSGDFFLCGDTITTDTSFTISGTTVTKPTTSFVTTFVLRLLSTDGSYVWDSWIYTSLNTYATSVVLDGSTLYLGGRSNQTSTDFYVGGVNVGKTPTSNYSGYIIRFNYSGTYASNAWIDGADFDYIQKLVIFSSFLHVMGSSSSSDISMTVNGSFISKPPTLNSAGFVFVLHPQTLEYQYGFWIDGSANEYNRNLILTSDKIFLAGISNSNETALEEGGFTVTKPATSSVFGYASLYQLDQNTIILNSQVLNASAGNVRMYKVFGLRGSTVGKDLPVLVTAAVTSITATTAISGGTISSDGGFPVTARGVCWNTTGSPTIGNNKTTNGSGVGTFVSNLSGLSNSTTYYVRAYATNSTGTSYGNQLTFTTPASSVVLTNIVNYMDAGNVSSYPGSGTTWFDLSPQSRNGSIVGATYSSDNGGCFVFNGTSSYVETVRLPGTGTPTFSQSICVWVSPNDNNGNIVSVSELNPQGGWNMPPITADASRFRGKYWNNSYLYSSTYTNNQWYYVCQIFDYAAGQQRLYVNGSLVASQSGATYSSSGTDNYFYLGQQNPGSDNMGFFAGRIAILQVYSNKALTNAEVLDNYNTDKGRFGLP